MRDEALNMLVVDDNPMLVSVLSEIFHECGHNVRIALDGLVALAEIRRKVPDILLSDLAMPGMSGYELLSVVRRQFPGIRVIAMSGTHSGDGVPAGVSADAFYSKGESSVAHLLEVVRTLWREEATAPRSSAPLWLSEPSFDHAGAPVLLASCPECLGPVPNRLTSIEMQRGEETCPRCLKPIELAFVRQTTGLDGTPISLSPERPRVDHAALEARWSGDAPTGRMLQQ